MRRDLAGEVEKLLKTSNSYVGIKNQAHPNYNAFEEIGHISLRTVAQASSIAAWSSSALMSALRALTP